MRYDCNVQGGCALKANKVIYDVGIHLEDSRPTARIVQFAHKMVSMTQLRLYT